MKKLYTIMLFVLITGITIADVTNIAGIVMSEADGGYFEAYTAIRTNDALSVTKKVNQIKTLTISTNEPPVEMKWTMVARVYYSEGTTNDLDKIDSLLTGATGKIQIVKSMMTSRKAKLNYVNGLWTPRETLEFMKANSGDVMIAHANKLVRGKKEGLINDISGVAARAILTDALLASDVTKEAKARIALKSYMSIKQNKKTRWTSDEKHLEFLRKFRNKVYKVIGESETPHLFALKSQIITDIRELRITTGD